MKDRTKCNDFGDRPGCLGEPDQRYTMRFDDIGESPILWCSHCGPEAKAMDDALSNAFKADPGFAKRLEAEIEKVEVKLN